MFDVVRRLFGGDRGGEHAAAVERAGGKLDELVVLTREQVGETKSIHRDVRKIRQRMEDAPFPFVGDGATDKGGT